MITAKESKQAAKGRMQMYQPAQRLARGNAEQRNGQLFVVIAKMMMVVVVMTKKSCDCIVRHSQSQES